jgi:hypothetical protein
VNETSQIVYDKVCEEDPYWGVVFIWWASAAFLLGAATTTGVGVAKEVFTTIRLYGCSRDRSTVFQIADMNADKPMPPLRKYATDDALPENEDS